MLGALKEVQRPRQQQNQKRSRSAPRCGCFACDLAFDVHPLHAAEHRSGRRGTTGMEAGRALPGHGWPVGAVPRRAREAQGTGGQLFVLRRHAAGRTSLVTFFGRSKKVTRATARNSAPTPENNNTDRSSRKLSNKKLERAQPKHRTPNKRSTTSSPPPTSPPSSDESD